MDLYITVDSLEEGPNPLIDGLLERMNNRTPALDIRRDC